MKRNRAIGIAVGFINEFNKQIKSARIETEIKTGKWKNIGVIKMLEPLKMNVNINDIYQYKLKSFFNSRALSINEEKFIFIDSVKNKEKVLSIHIKIMIFFFI
ncbi:hypothetical protein IC611_10575 [Proteus mirabilis]